LCAENLLYFHTDQAEETPVEAEEESDEDKEKRLRREAAAAAAKQEWESLSEEQKADRKQTEQFEHLVRGLRKRMVELVICADTLGQNRSFTNDQVRFPSAEHASTSLYSC